MNNITKNKIHDGQIVSERLKFILDKIDLDDSKIIFDIGSWHLNQSIELNSIFPNAIIHAFEPVPESYNECINKSSSYSNIKVHNLALSNFNGEASFYPVDPNLSSSPNIGASSLLKFKDGLNGSFFNQTWVQKEIKTQVKTLDEWVNINNINFIDIIWIDVQGSELQVFEGAKNILQNTKVILTEVGLKPYYEGHSMKKDIDIFMDENNFIEVSDSFELNGFDFEANTIYVNKNYLNQL